MKIIILMGSPNKKGSIPMKLIDWERVYREENTWQRRLFRRQGVTDSSLKYHILNAKNHGVSQKEMAAAITHVAFYAGWPKAWAVFNLAKEVYAEGGESK